MKADTSKLLDTIRPDSSKVYGEYIISVYREDGSIERKVIPNVVTRAGLNRMAHRAVANDTSAFNYLIIGTQTATHSLDSAQAGIGEVSRKAGATVANSREWAYLQNTWGGSSDSLTGVALDSVGITDYANSSAASGILGSAINGMGVTLQNSDLLDVTYRARIGSHNLSHST
jgi:hypothetical protein